MAAVPAEGTHSAGPGTGDTALWAGSAMALWELLFKDASEQWAPAQGAG